MFNTVEHREGCTIIAIQVNAPTISSEGVVNDRWILQSNPCFRQTLLSHVLSCHANQCPVTVILSTMMSINFKHYPECSNITERKRNTAFSPGLQISIFRTISSQVQNPECSPLSDFLCHVRTARVPSFQRTYTTFWICRHRNQKKTAEKQKRCFSMSGFVIVLYTHTLYNHPIRWSSTISTLKFQHLNIEVLTFQHWSA